MARKCTTCQHLKRPEIDRRLAAGEPADQIARDYDLNRSSLYRHRTNCLQLSSSNAIMKDAARGTAAAKSLKAGVKFKSDNVYALELENGARVLAVPADDANIRGLTVDGWIVADKPPA
jgi:hypothetical protein